jgi:hypothetical protein
MTTTEIEELLEKRRYKMAKNGARVKLNGRGLHRASAELLSSWRSSFRPAARSLARPFPRSLTSGLQQSIDAILSNPALARGDWEYP